jgi:hypothetical protein
MPGLVTLMPQGIMPCQHPSRRFGKARISPPVHCLLQVNARLVVADRSANCAENPLNYRVFASAPAYAARARSDRGGGAFPGGGCRDLHCPGTGTSDCPTFPRSPQHSRPARKTAEDAQGVRRCPSLETSIFGTLGKPHAATAPSFTVTDRPPLHVAGSSRNVGANFSNPPARQRAHLQRDEAETAILKV